MINMNNTLYKNRLKKQREEYINENLKNNLLEQSFTGFKIIDINSLKNYEEKRTGRKLYPKDYKKNLP